MSAAPNIEPETRTARWVRSLSRVLGLYGFLGGVISLLGWVLDVPRLTDWSNTGVSIQPNTCLAITLTGSAVLLLSFEYRRAAAILGIAVFLIGVVSGFQLLFQVDL